MRQAMISPTPVACFQSSISPASASNGDRIVDRQQLFHPELYDDDKEVVMLPFADFYWPRENLDGSVTMMMGFSITLLDGVSVDDMDVAVEYFDNGGAALTLTMAYGMFMESAKAVANQRKTGIKRKYQDAGGDVPDSLEESFENDNENVIARRKSETLFHAARKDRLRQETPMGIFRIPLPKNVEEEIYYIYEHTVNGARGLSIDLEVVNDNKFVGKKKISKFGI